MYEVYLQDESKTCGFFDKQKQRSEKISLGVK